MGTLIQSGQQFPGAREPDGERAAATRSARTFRLRNVIIEGANDFIMHLPKEWAQGTRELITDDGNMICNPVDAGAERPVRLNRL